MKPSGNLLARQALQFDTNKRLDSTLPKSHSTPKGLPNGFIGIHVNTIRTSIRKSIRITNTDKHYRKTIHKVFLERPYEYLIVSLWFHRDCIDSFL